MTTGGTASKVTGRFKTQFKSIKRILYPWMYRILDPSRFSRFGLAISSGLIKPLLLPVADSSLSEPFRTAEFSLLGHEQDSFFHRDIVKQMVAAARRSVASIMTEISSKFRGRMLTLSKVRLLFFFVSFTKSHQSFFCRCWQPVFKLNNADHH